MRQDVKVSIANRSAIITKSTFNNYDACINPYVGCEFGCTYCYVRFFIKDDEKPWGDFVRVRDHLTEKLPRELDKGYIRISDGREPIMAAGAPIVKDGKVQTKPKRRDIMLADCRLVFGTMTDPYQPVERKYRITRSALQILLNHPTQLKKVGIFTRSPIVVDDLDLIARLPQARVHYTVTPFPPEVMRVIEPISPRTARRWDTLRAIKSAGIRLHVNVSPVMPLISDPFVDEFAQQLAEIEPAEFFVDPMQPYKESFESFQGAMVGTKEWPTIEAIMTDPEYYHEWKAQYRGAWERAWAKYGASKKTLPIWCDHQYKVWVDMRTGEQMSHRQYGDEAV